MDYQFPDDMVAEVLTEATRLHAEASKGYSFADLQQACFDLQIPQHLIEQAIVNVQAKRSAQTLKRQQLQAYVTEQFKKGIAAGASLLIPAIAVSSLFIFRAQFEPFLFGFSSRFNPRQQKPNTAFPTLTVKKDKLEYLVDEKGLSISITDTSAGQYSFEKHTSVQGSINTDSYKSLDIKDGKVGDLYEYKGIYDYRIKILEVSGDRVTFQVKQQGKQSWSTIQRLKNEVQILQAERDRLKTKSRSLEIENTELKSRQVMTEADFRKAIANQTEEGVSRAVGRPNLEESMGDNARSWTYEYAVKDSASGKISSARVYFRNGVSTDVYFPDF